MLRPEPDCRDGDALLERSRGLLGKAIRWFTGSMVNHVGLVFRLTPQRAALLRDYGQRIPEKWIGRWCVIEALWRVKVSPLHRRLGEKSQVGLYRCRRLDGGQRGVIVRAALGFAGQQYGVKRILVFGATLAMAKWPVLRRWRPMRRMELDEVICSYLLAYTYSLVGEHFGPGPGQLKRPRECSPGDILATTRWDDGWVSYWSELDMPET